MYLFISQYSPTAGIPRIRAHGEDLSPSARLSSAAADRALFHSLWWKRVHRDLRARIVCALRCLITFDWTPYYNLGSGRERGSSSKMRTCLPQKKKKRRRPTGWVTKPSWRSEAKRRIRSDKILGGVKVSTWLLTMLLAQVWLILHIKKTF